MLICVLSLGIFCSLTGCGQNAPSKKVLSQLVADAIISDNAGWRDGECSAEGHKILGSGLSDGRLKIYALTTYGNYGFCNNQFIKISGTGVIPAVLTFEKDGADYTLLKVEYPKDGSEYTESIIKLFPLRYRLQALMAAVGGQYNALSAQERSYAEAYLKSIGRDAEIGEYKDLERTRLTEFGVSVEVSNKVFTDRRLSKYPSWLGTNETVENGKRYIRSKSLDRSAGQIIFKTVEAESDRVTEIFIFDASTGEELTDAPAGDMPPMITIYGKNYFSPYMPVNELPEGYTYIGELPEEAENDTGLAGCKMYALTELDTLSDFYLFQECGTPISENTVDSTQREWAYVKWVRQNH